MRTAVSVSKPLTCPALEPRVRPKWSSQESYEGKTAPPATDAGGEIFPPAD